MKRLSRANPFFYKFAELTTDAVFVLQGMGDIIFWNKAAERIFEYTAEEVIGKNIQGLILPPHAFENHYDFSQEWLQPGGTSRSTVEIPAVSKSGRRVETELTYIPFQVNERNYALAMIRDITERKNQEEILHKSEERYRSLADSIPDIMFVEDAQGKVIYLNRAAAELIGRDPSEIIGQFQENLFTPEVATKHRSHLKDVFEMGNSISIEENTTLFTGDTVWTETRLVPLFDKNKCAYAIMGLTRDITGRKVAAESLRQSEERLRIAFQTLPDIAIIARLDDVVCVDVNERFCKFTGYSRDEMIGLSASEDKVWFIPSDLEKAIKHLKRDGFLSDFETQLVTKDGLIRTCLLFARIIMIDQVRHILCIARDITEQKRANDQLRQSEERFRTVFQDVSRCSCNQSVG